MAVAVFAPPIESVRLSNLFDVRIQSIRAAEGYPLPRVYVVRLPVAGGFALAFAHGNDGIGSIFAGFYSISTWLIDGECLIGCVDFEYVIVLQVAHAHVDRAGAELDLHRPVVEIEKGDSSIAVELNRG